MKQNDTQVNSKTVDVFDILSLFVKKLKLIVIVALVAAILGGALGCLVTSINTTYNSTFVISISPAISNETALYALRSGMFNEQLLYDESGLPPKEKCDAQDYENAKTALATYEEARAFVKEKQEEFELYYIADIEQKREMLLSEYNRAKAALDTYKSAQAENVVTEDHIVMTKTLETAFLSADKALKDYQNKYYNPAKETQKALEKELLLAKKDVAIKRDLADEAFEEATKSWRNDPQVAKTLEKLTKYVTYEHLKTVQSSETSQSQTVNCEYITVKISIPASDKILVDKIVNGYRLHLCDAIEKYIEDVGDTAKSECDITESSFFVNREPRSLVPNALLFALVFAMLGAFFSCFVLVVQFFQSIKKGKGEECSEDESAKILQ